MNQTQTSFASNATLVEKTRALYTDPAAVRRELRKGTIRQQALRALHMASVAAHPAGRFGLDTVPVEVRRAIQVEQARIACAVEPIAAVLVAARREGHAMDTAWGNVTSAGLGELGFSYGCSDEVAAVLLAVGARDLVEGL